MPNDTSNTNITTTDNATEKLQPWHRQPWDCDAGYRAFHDFYLQLEPGKRSVDEAYRKFKTRSVQDVQQKCNIKRAPGTWVCWSQGRIWDGKNGKDYDGAISWKLRAQAYDDYIRSQTDKLDQERRIQQELEMRNDLFKFAHKITKKLETAKTDISGYSDIKKALESIELSIAISKGEHIANVFKGDFRGALTYEQADALMDKISQCKKNS